MKTHGTMTLVVAALALVAQPAGAQPQQQSFESIAYLYRAEGGLAGVFEELMILDGLATARTASGSALRQAQSTVSAAVTAELQSQLLPILDGVLTVDPGCDSAPPNSVRYTFGMWRNGKLQTLTVCNPNVAGSLVQDSQLLLQQVFRAQHLVGRVAEFEVQGAAPLGAAVSARGLTVYEDGRVSAWHRDATGQLLLDGDLAGESRLNWELRHLLRQELRQHLEHHPRSRYLDAAAPAPGGPVQIRLFDASMEGRALVLDGDDLGSGGTGGGVMEVLLAHF